jgi:hypothetical protein
MKQLWLKLNNLKKVNRFSATFFFFFFLYIEKSFSLGYGPGSVCYDCYPQIGPSFMSYGPSSFWNIPSSPYWSLYAQNNYGPSANYPGAWNQGSGALNSQYYPYTWATGGCAGKPNVYFHGPEGKSFSFAPKLIGRSELLATTPAVNGPGDKIMMTIKNKKIVVDDVSYDYFYYDYAVDITQLQDERGTCVSKKGLIPVLLEMLVTSGFTPKEQKDFLDYWPFKMPPAESYCIYPQTEQDLAKVAPLEIEGDIEMKRILFMIVPQTSEFKKSKDRFKGKFRSTPTFSWSAQIPLEVSSFKIHEWGVAFMAL